MNSEPSHLAAWCQWGLRWVWLVAIPLALGTSGPMAGPLLAVLAVYALLQLLLSAGLLRAWTVALRPETGSVLDAAAGLALILSAGGSSLSWLGLLLAAASAGFAGGGGAGLRTAGAVMLVGGGVLGAYRGSLAIGLVQAGVHGLLLIPAGALLGALAARLVAEAELTGFRSLLVTAGLGGRRPVLDLDQVPDVRELLQRLHAEALHALHANGIPRRGLEALAVLKSGSGWIVIAGTEQVVDAGKEVQNAGFMARALESGLVQVSSAPEREAVLAELTRARGWACAACVPLHDGERELGALLLGHRRLDSFEGEPRRALQAAAREARLAARYARLYRQLEAERDRMTEVQEEARRKLARDLHDGPTQTIAAIAMRTNFARRELDHDLEGAQEELRKVEEMARQTTKEIRHMLFTLRPLILETQGLAVALHQFAQKVHDTHGQAVWVDAEPELAARLNDEQQAMLFYIAEEAVTNACKHAAAENVWIRLSEAGDEFALEVEDDGVGFNVGAVDAHYEQRGSLGMVTMRERSELLNADFRVHSQEGQGTRIRVLLPSAPTAGGDPPQDAAADA